MKKATVLMLMLTLIAVSGLADVTVNYIVNTSTLQGVTDSTHQVQICGAEVGPEGVDKWYNLFLTWGDESPLAANIGGDYWKLTIAYPDSMIGWRMAYKVRYKANDDDAFTWENVTGGGNRMWVLPANDTTLAVAYVNNDFNPPFTPSDSVDILVRVKMENYEDSFSLLSVVGHWPFCDPEWTPGALPLTQEGTSDYWSRTIRIPQAVMDTVDRVQPLGAEHPGVLMYRFAIGNDWNNSENLNGKYWPGNENRIIALHPGLEDTTLAWKYWNDNPPAGFIAEDTVDITFTADLTNAIANKGFAVGDTILVRMGYFNSLSSTMDANLLRISGTYLYSTTFTDVPVVLNEPLYYQYYLVKDAVEQREVYFNFDYEGEDVTRAERRAYVITGDAEINDIEDSETDPRRMPKFRNNQKLSQAVTVTIECDLRPAYYQVWAGSTLDDIQGNIDITPAMLEANPDTLAKLGLCINGPMSNNGEGTWATWGGTLASDATRRMYDDGTNGDETAGDTIYTIVYNFTTEKTIGQEFKFGIGGGDNESSYGLNHIENIDDTNPTFTLEVQFGSINPNFYSAWDFNARAPKVGIKNQNVSVAKEFSLSQNFPNPFNPTTEIRFTISEKSDVHLTIYNLLGKVVNKVTYNNLDIGNYSYVWNSKDLNGNSVASGIYFYELRAGSKYHAIKKMVLMK